MSQKFFYPILIQNGLQTLLTVHLDEIYNENLFLTLIVINAKISEANTQKKNTYILMSTVHMIILQ